MADARKSYNYILSVRNAQGKVFGNDIGEPTFLKVPRDTRPALEHKIKNPAVWLRQVRDIADGLGGDVASDSLDADCAWATPMFGRTMRLTNYSNGFDSVLAVSNAKRLGTAPRVGRVGLTGKHHTKAVNVDCSEYFNHLDTNEPPIKVGTWSHSWHIGN